MPQSVRVPTADGHILGGTVWRHTRQAPQPRPVVVVNSATSVRARYYARFATYLHQHGFDVLTYDYRGIGESRPASLRGFQADWIDWGERDFEAALQYVAREFEGQPIHVVGHSIGGFVIGLAPSAHRVQRIVTVGAQFAYSPDYAPTARTRMRLRWHLAMPVLAHLFGYVPARRLGWMEDTPKGVALDWARMGPRFEDCVRRGRTTEHGEPQGPALARRFAQVTAPMLAVGIDDDPFGTPAALERLLAYYVNAERQHVRIGPAEVGEREIGHFAFFHERFRDRLWGMVVEWLDAASTQQRPNRHRA